MPSPIFPEEMIVEILLRLPVRSLLQFRCVCKLWKTLISDPQFAKKHVLISTAYPQLVSLFAGIAKCNLVSYPLKPLLDNPSAHRVEPANFETRHSTSIIGTFNGLLCLHSFSQFFVWNPSIKLKSNLSPTITAFDRFKLLYCGFGYDQVNDRYKVVAVVLNGCNLDETTTLIYTFGEKNWTTIQNFPCDQRCDRGWLGVGKFLSGTLNWIVNKDVSKKMIVSFDLEKQTYGEMSLPQHYCDDNTVLYVSNNRIYISFDHPSKTHWVVWIMKEYGVVESWTNLMIISKDKLTSSDFGRFCLSDALFIPEYGVFFMRPQHSKLSLYNLNNDGGLDYCTTISGHFGRNLHIYNESLVSPHWLKHSQKKNKRKRKQKLSEGPKLVL